jgi:hypothetical protein
MPARHLRPAALCAVSALALAGCKIDNRPLLARGAPAPADYAYAPDATALPYAEPAQVAPPADYYDGYALAQRAYAHDRVAYREPPAYGFEYGDVEPWVWQTADDDLMFAEPIDDGYRVYYYEPGEAYPYFVRDPDYGYAYGPGGVLAALFDATGALLPQQRLYDYAPVAGRYLARGRDLRQVYYREPRVAVAGPVWSRRAPALEAAQGRWIAAAERQPALRERPPREVRTFDPVPLPREPAFAARQDFGRRDLDRRHDGRRAFREPRAFAPNAQQHASDVTARVEERQARDLRRQAFEQARANRHAAHAESPQPPAVQRHGGGRHETRPDAPQRQAFNGAHGGGPPQARPAPAQPQAGGGRGGGDPGGKDHGGRGGGDRGHGDGGHGGGHKH